ncbi:vanadium-dependent haloperoxidase [Fulvivirga sp. M361]|uniref:vanadium-dependent haloperoxidase n=1 Tax=Fulvivirga sp. M361 TaxID=2594266 RepID=UPI00117A272D|nr:vanadium-dependent haloperoxidase [Fulvivirga sp. M361]TRX59925.1 vanadium-dependent haloperoxidase [Fulvivirga sp. M361]
MKKENKIFIWLLAFSFITSCNPGKETVVTEPSALHEAMQELTDVIVHDIFSPPVASRIYAYPSIAAYEVLAVEAPNYRPLAGQLRDFEAIPEPKAAIDLQVAAVDAFLLVGKALIFSEEKLETYRKNWHEQVKQQGLDETILKHSIAYAEEVATHVLTWADKDNYKETRTFQKFTITDDVSRWQPTPPGYMEAIEPHWNKIRPFVIDSANQFVPERPTAFDMDENSPFYKETMEVYTAVKELDEEEKEIASFWDCNPYVMNVHGHVMFATKKITPGGHWMGIAKIASQKAEADLMKTAQAYSLTAIALADAFISCWDEKYRSSLIRPETVINKYIDEEWLPFLQTPPFPEYTSGHSVISGAAGEALTAIYGEPFHFVDSTEVRYGLTAREFDSFRSASDEAAISRLYGGIHYMPAIENGVAQGRSLGKLIVDRIEMGQAAENVSGNKKSK